jgi:hypothetical protein
MRFWWLASCAIMIVAAGSDRAEAQPAVSGLGPVPVVCAPHLEDQEKQLDDFAKKYGEVQLQLKQCTQNARPPAVSSPGGPDDPALVVRERDRLRNEVSDLKVELGIARKKIADYESDQGLGSLVTIPCVAATVDEVGSRKTIRVVATSETDERQLRQRASALKGADVEVRLIPEGQASCLHSAGAFVLAAERAANPASTSLEQVHNRASAGFFRAVEDNIISFEQCAEAASALRDAKILQDLAKSDLTLWAARNKVLGQCREDRSASLDRQWVWQGGRPDDRSGLLVLVFSNQQR